MAILNLTGDVTGDRQGEPAQWAETITPSDTVNLRAVSRAIYVGVAGDVAAVMQNGDVATFVGVTAGSILPIRAIRINSTNTTATTMLNLY